MLTSSLVPLTPSIECIHRRITYKYTHTHTHARARARARIHVYTYILSVDDM